MSHPSLKHTVSQYVIGFSISLLLTGSAFALAMIQQQSGGIAYPVTWLLAGLIVLALVQLVVQLVFFLHLGKEARPKLQTHSFLFMVLVVITIGFGSLWIMANLDYNMMPKDVETYMEEKENIRH